MYPMNLVLHSHLFHRYHNKLHWSWEGSYRKSLVHLHTQTSWNIYHTFLVKNISKLRGRRQTIKPVPYITSFTSLAVDRLDLQSSILELHKRGPPAGSQITRSRKIFPVITRSRKSSKFVHHAKIAKYRPNHASRLKFLPYHASRQNVNHAITPKNMPNHAITPQNTPDHAITQTAGGGPLTTPRVRKKKRYSARNDTQSSK